MTILNDIKDAVGIIMAAIIFFFLITGIILVGVVLPIRQFLNMFDSTYEGQVIATEQTNFIYPHTIIYMKTYSEDMVTFRVEGYQSLKNDVVYRITVQGNFWHLFRTMEEATPIE